MKLKCKRCNRVWNYKGKKKVGSYVTCPDCKTPIKLKKSDYKGGRTK